MQKDFGKNGKKQMKLVVLGHVDSGKSTTIGNLSYRCGGINQSVIEEYEKEAKELDKESFKFAWVLDKLKAEREKGMTIDLSYLNIESKNRVTTCIDVPGHKDFIKNMIIGVTQADSAILVISASNGEFEIGFGENGQTKRHAIFAYTVGIKSMIVAVNKMDKTDPPYSEDRFTSICAEVGLYLEKTGFLKKNICFVPYSGFQGTNLTTKPTGMDWYKGPTLLEAIDTLEPPTKLIDRPLRIPLQDVYKITGIGTVPVGRVETGFLKPGMMVSFAPGKITTECKTLEMGNFEEAIPGDNAAFNIKGVTPKEIGRGFVVGEAKNNPPREAKEFTAHVVVLSSKIQAGYTSILNCHISKVPCRLERIQHKINRRTGEVIDTEPKEIINQEVGLCLLSPSTTKPLIVEAYRDFPSLGRFTMKDTNRIVAVGLIHSVDKIEVQVPKHK